MVLKEGVCVLVCVHIFAPVQCMIKAFCAAVMLTYGSVPLHFCAGCFNFIVKVLSPAINMERRAWRARE